MRFVILFLTAILFGACQNKESLQQYFVKNSENPDFVSFNFSPKNFLKEQGLDLNDANLLEQIKNVNILLLDKKDSILVKKEYNHLKTILQDESYQDLARITSNGVKIQVDYVGTDENIKEVVILANQSSQQLAVVRILTNEIKVKQLMEITSKMQNGSLNGLENIFKSL